MDLLKVPAAKKQVSAKKKKKIKESLSSLSLLASAAASSRTGKHQLPYYDILPPKYRIQPTDIICGRKAVTFANKDSNVFYRELTEQCFLHYEAVDITQKARVSKAIFSTLKKRGYRFVSCDSFWDPDTIEVGYLMSDEKSIEKIRCVHFCVKEVEKFGRFSIELISRTTSFPSSNLVLSFHSFLCLSNLSTTMLITLVAACSKSFFFLLTTDPRPTAKPCETFGENNTQT